jgi:hypothetical protein
MMEEERHYQFVYISAAALHHRLLPLCDLFHFNRGEIFLRIIRVRSWMRERILANKGKEKYKEQEMSEREREDDEKERKEKSAMLAPAFKRGSSR